MGTSLGRIHQARHTRNAREVGSHQAVHLRRARGSDLILSDVLRTVELRDVHTGVPRQPTQHSHQSNRSREHIQEARRTREQHTSTQGAPARRRPATQPAPGTASWPPMAYDNPAVSAVSVYTSTAVTTSVEVRQYPVITRRSCPVSLYLHTGCRKSAHKSASFRHSIITSQARRASWEVRR